MLVLASEKEQKDDREIMAHRAFNQKDLPAAGRITARFGQRL